MLTLDQKAFDQDLHGGWRELAARPNCKLAAADLIRDYRVAHGSTSSTLFWHEGQLRAAAGHAAGAIALMEQSRKGSGDKLGWDLYVDATVAFLRRDRIALLAAREALSRVPRPVTFDPRDQQGRPLLVEWPMNLTVVDALIRCFDRSYAQAYGRTCRQ